MGVCFITRHVQRWRTMPSLSLSSEFRHFCVRILKTGFCHREHRIYRLPDCLSLRRDRVPPPPYPPAGVAYLPFGYKGKFLAGGDPILTTDTLSLSMYTVIPLRPLAKKERRFCLICFSVQERNYGLFSELR